MLTLHISKDGCRRNQSTQSLPNVLAHVYDASSLLLEFANRTFGVHSVQRLAVNEQVDADRDWNPRANDRGQDSI